MSKYLAILALFIVQISFSQEDYVYRSARQNLIKAYEHLGKEETKAALEYFDKVNPSDSLYDFSQLNKFISAYSGKFYSASIKACDLAIETGSAYASEAYFFKVKSLIKMGEYVKADQVIKKALQLFPLMFSFDYLRAEMLYEKKEYEQAKSLLQSIVTSHPQHSDSHALLANIYAKQAAETEAILAYQMAIISNRGSEVLRKSFIEMEDVMKGNFDVTNEQKDHKQFKQINGLINSKVAVQKSYKAGMRIFNYSNNVTDLIFNQLSFNSSSTYFPMKYYGGFLQEVKKAGLEKGYILYLLEVLNNPSVIKFQNKYRHQMVEIEKMLYKFFQDQVNSNKFPINGDVLKRDYILNERGRLIGVGKLNEENNPVGHVTYYYTTGQVSADLNYNDEGKFHGENKWYNKDGLIKETGEYENGKINGTGSYANKNGSMVYQGEFVEGKLKGEVQSYYSNGLLRIIKNFDGKKATGPVREFYQMGQLLASYDVVEDEINGAYLSMYPNGDTLVSSNYIDGKEDGKYLEYHPNGQLSAKGNYKQGSKEGLWKDYFYNGNLKASYNYKSDKLNGKYIELDLLGDTLITANYANDLLHGAYKDYGANNKVLWKHYYKKGKFKKYISFNPDGSVLREGKKEYVLNDRFGFKYIEATRKGNNYQGEYKAFWKSGGIKEQYSYNKKGVLDGYSTTYFENGEKDEQMYYKNGELHGEYISYFDNGTVYLEGNYSEGNEVGVWKRYHANGKLERTLYFDKGERIGHLVDYDLNGVKTSDIKYDGKLSYSTKIYNPSGEKVFEITTPGGTGDYNLTNIYGQKYFEAKIVSGLIHGKLVKYYPNGEIMETSNLVYGEANGPFKSFYPNGQLKREGLLEYGNKTGPWKSYHFNGKLSWEGTYENDLVRDSIKTYFPTGELREISYYNGNGDLVSEKSYHTNGVLMSHVPYERGFIHGNYSNYDAFGELIINREFNGGVEVGYSYYKDGKLIEMIPMNDENEVKAFFNNGKASFSYDYNNNLYDGSYKRFYSNGNKWIETSYDKDACNGERKSYYPNGQLRAESNYNKGRLNGVFKYFNDQGLIMMEETYVEGNKEGIAKYYDDNGKLLYTLSYKDGVVVKIN